MSGYRTVKELIKKARMLQRLYCGRYTDPDEPTLELCHSMARNSFIAHSVLEGYARPVVHQVANHVFAPETNQRPIAA